MMLTSNWKHIADQIVRNNSPEVATSSLAQEILEATFMKEKPTHQEVEHAHREIRDYIIEVWACNADT